MLNWVLNIGLTELHYTRNGLFIVTEFLSAMKRLLGNCLYICVVLGICFQFYSIIGYFAFLPKYLESYFGTTTAVSNSVVGPCDNYKMLINIFSLKNKITVS